METNESILSRDVVGLDDRRVVGAMRELRVSCDDLAVSHLIVASATTTSPLVLPFDRVLSVGDTFITIQSRDDFMPASSTDAQTLLANGFKLIGVDVFSRTGDKLGIVASYEWDPTFATVISMTLDNGIVFPASDFVFFAPEFVFVDNHNMTAAELRAAQGDAAVVPAAEVEAVAVADQMVATEQEVVEDYMTPYPVEGAVAVAVADALEEPAVEEAMVDETLVTAADEADEEVEEAVAAGYALEESEEIVEDEDDEDEDETELSDEDAQLVELLLGTTLNNSVTSEDGAFAVAKGVVVTREIVDEAIEHDALLLLTLAADL